MRLISLITVIGWLGHTAPAQHVVPARKVAFANEVLQRIGATYGFGVLALPKLVIYPRRKGNNHIAYLELVLAPGQKITSDLDRSRLLIDEELIDVCTAVDQNGAAPGTALAFVMAHEMAHFYLKHATFRNFADQREAPMAKAESYRQEKEADKTGLLFAHLAGYDPAPILDALFNRLYSEFKLKDPLPGHPAKSERQQETKLRSNEFRKYGYLFAVGHALYCREKFAEAARCFEYVYTRYPLKEAYTNFGVCRLQEAIRLKKKTPVSYFALPFEVDPRNRLLRMGERGGTTANNVVTSLLKEADAAFKQAIAMDNRYCAAYLNQAIGELLAENYYAALGVLSTLKTQTGLTLPPNGYLMQAIAHQALGDNTRAEASLNMAVAQKAFQIAYNSSVFKFIKKGTVNTLRLPWQQINTKQVTLTGLGCQAGTVVLQEVDEAPAAIQWVIKPLIELNNPPPFVVVDYGLTGPEMYFRVKMGDRDSLTLQPDLFFVRKNQVIKPNR